MADLQGPKIRVGKFDDGKVHARGRRRSSCSTPRAPSRATASASGLDYKELPRDVKPGDTLLLNDGLIVLDGRRGARRAGAHHASSVGGELSNNKGINKQGGGLTAPALTAKDMEDIKTAMSFQADYLAVSFPKNATDMEMARQLRQRGRRAVRHKPALIAKIERAEAIPDARGDPQGQRRHHGRARRPRGRGRQRRRAGAAEAHDPHGARDGQGGDHRDADDGVDDRQPGADARRGERRRQRGARRHRRGDAQRRDGGRQVPGRDGRADGRDLRSRPSGPRTSRSTPTSPTRRFGRIDQSIAMGALFTAHHLGCKAIVALTESGSTALWMSRHRIHVPIFAPHARKLATPAQDGAVPQRAAAADGPATPTATRRWPQAEALW